MVCFNVLSMNKFVSCSVDKCKVVFMRIKMVMWVLDNSRV